MDYMIPLRGGGKSVSTYYIKVSADSLDSYLPYFGQARHIPYGGGKGLNFQEKIDTYSDTGATSERRSVGWAFFRWALGMIGRAKIPRPCAGTVGENVAVSKN